MDKKLRNLYVSDMDGTLLRDDSTLGKLTIKGLDLLYEEGVAFTVASARDIGSIKDKLGKLRFHMPVIEYNGAFITDYETGKKLDSSLVPREHCAKVQEIITSSTLPILVNILKDGQDYFVYDERNHNGGSSAYATYRKGLSERHIYLAPGEDLSNFDLICFNAIGRYEETLELFNRLEENFKDILEIHMMRGTPHEEWYWINVANIKATKAGAIERLRKMYEKRFKIHSFGDNRNDLEMLSVSDTGIAMGNATQQLKDKADLIIGTNQEDSVIRFILEQENLKINI